MKVFAESNSHTPNGQGNSNSNSDKWSRFINSLKSRINYIKNRGRSITSNIQERRRGR